MLVIFLNKWFEMLRFHLKDLFQERIADILSLLIIVHVGSLLSLFLIKYIHPYLKKFVAMYNGRISSTTDSVTHLSKSVQSNSKEKQKIHDRNIWNETNDSSESDEEFFKTIESLKSLIDVLSQEEELCNSFREKSLSDESFMVGNIVGRSNNERKFSIETQTVISIDAKLQIDDPYLRISSDTPVEKTPSSSHSPALVASDLMLSDKKENVQDVNEDLGCFDILNNITEQGKSKEQKQNDSAMISLKINDKCNLISECVQRDVSQENKVLEKAIKDLEKELKPIQDQIQALKKCLNALENKFSKQCISSDIASSETETLWISDNLSETISTTHTHTSTLFNCISHHSVLENNSMPIEYSLEIRKKEVLCERKSNLQLFNTSNNVIDRRCKDPTDDKSLSCARQNELSLEPLTSPKKRSPVAEMYVKLAQSNSQSNHQFRKRKHNSIPCYVNGNTVTCHINLNMSVSAVSISNDPRTSCLNETSLSPILSSPEDIIEQFCFPCIPQIRRRTNK